MPANAIARFLPFLAIAIWAWASSVHAQDPSSFESKLLEMNRQKTVFVQVHDGEAGPVLATGSGVLLRDGYVLTSLHLVGEMTEEDFGSDTEQKFVTGIVGANEGIQYRLNYIRRDAERDLILFRFSPQIAQGFSHVCLAKKMPAVGDLLGSLGFPLGMSLMPVVDRLNGEEPTFLVSAMPVTFGDSGSGVYNTDGDLVGIVKGGLTFITVDPATNTRVVHPTPLARIVPLGLFMNLLNVYPNDDSNCDRVSPAPSSSPEPPADDGIVLTSERPPADTPSPEPEPQANVAPIPRPANERPQDRYSRHFPGLCGNMTMYARLGDRWDNAYFVRLPKGADAEARIYFFNDTPWRDIDVRLTLQRIGEDEDPLRAPRLNVLTLDNFNLPDGLLWDCGVYRSGGTVKAEYSYSVNIGSEYLDSLPRGSYSVYWSYAGSGGFYSSTQSLVLE